MGLTKGADLLRGRGALSEKFTGEEGIDQAAAWLLISREISISGAGSAGLGVGIGAISRTWGGFAEGFARTRS